VVLYISPQDDVDTRRIESFLLCQEGVVDANVWTKNTSVLARVTVMNDACCDETGLQSACEQALGKNLTPSMIMLQRALRPAA